MCSVIKLFTLDLCFAGYYNTPIKSFKKGKNKSTEQRFLDGRLENEGKIVENKPGKCVHVCEGITRNILGKQVQMTTLQTKRQFLKELLVSMNLH